MEHIEGQLEVARARHQSSSKSDYLQRRQAHINAAAQERRIRESEKSSRRLHRQDARREKWENARKLLDQRMESRKKRARSRRSSASRRGRHGSQSPRVVRLKAKLAMVKDNLAQYQRLNMKKSTAKDVFGIVREANTSPRTPASFAPPPQDSLTSQQEYPIENAVEQSCKAKDDNSPPEAAAAAAAAAGPEVTLQVGDLCWFDYKQYGDRYLCIVERKEQNLLRVRYMDNTIEENVPSYRVIPVGIELSPEVKGAAKLSFSAASVTDSAKERHSFEESERLAEARNHSAWGPEWRASWDRNWRFRNGEFFRASRESLDSTSKEKKKMPGYYLDLEFLNNLFKDSPSGQTRRFWLVPKAPKNDERSDHHVCEVLSPRRKRLVGGQRLRCDWESWRLRENLHERDRLLSRTLKLKSI